MSGLSYHTLDAAKAWSIAWIVLSGLGALLLFSGRSMRGKASSNLGTLGVLLTLPAEIVEAKLIFGQLTTVADLKMLNDFGPWFSGMRFLGWALVILALVVARTPHPQPHPLAHSHPAPPQRSNAPAPAAQTSPYAAKRPVQQPLGANLQDSRRPQTSNLHLILAKCAGVAFILTCVSAFFAPTVVVALYVVVTLVLATAAVFALYASKANAAQQTPAPSTPYSSGGVSHAKDHQTGPIPNPNSLPNTDQ